MQCRENGSFIKYIVSILVLTVHSCNSDTNVPHLPIKIGEQITQNEYYSFLQPIITTNQNYKKFVFVFLEDICASCESGNLVEELNDLQTQTDGVKFYVLLPGDFKTNDIENLKHNYLLGLDFLNVGYAFEELMRSKKSIQTRSSLDGLVVVTESSGLVSYVDLFSRKDFPMNAIFEGPELYEKAIRVRMHSKE